MPTKKKQPKRNKVNVILPFVIVLLLGLCIGVGLHTDKSPSLNTTNEVKDVGPYQITVCQDCHSILSPNEVIPVNVTVKNVIGVYGWYSVLEEYNITELHCAKCGGTNLTTYYDIDG